MLMGPYLAIAWAKSGNLGSSLKHRRRAFSVKSCANSHYMVVTKKPNIGS